LADHAAADVSEASETSVAAEPVDVLIEDLLVEEVSIDGMCGVY